MGVENFSIFTLRSVFEGRRGSAGRTASAIHRRAPSCDMCVTIVEAAGTTLAGSPLRHSVLTRPASAKKFRLESGSVTGVPCRIARTERQHQFRHAEELHRERHDAEAIGEFRNAAGEAIAAAHRVDADHSQTGRAPPSSASLAIVPLLIYESISNPISNSARYSGGPNASARLASTGVRTISGSTVNRRAPSEPALARMTVLA